MAFEKRIVNQQRTLPVSHIIRIGERYLSKGKLIPRKLDHFQVCHALPLADGRYPVDEELMKTIDPENQRPKELDIVLPGDNLTEVCPTYLSFYKSFSVGGDKGYRICRRFCWGNGETAERLNVKTGMYDEIECLGDKCQYRQPAPGTGRRECKMTTRLYCILPQSMEFGTYAKFESHGDITCSELLGSLEEIQRLMHGMLSGIPLKLRITGRKCAKGLVYTVHAVCTGDFQALVGYMQKAVELRTSIAQLGIAYNRPMLTQDLQAEDPVENADIVGNFYPDQDKNPEVGSKVIELKAKVVSDDEGSDGTVGPEAMQSAGPVVATLPAPAALPAAEPAKRKRRRKSTQNKEVDRAPATADIVAPDGTRYKIVNVDGMFFVDIGTERLSNADIEKLRALANGKFSQAVTITGHKPEPGFIETTVAVDGYGTLSAMYNKPTGELHLMLNGKTVVTNLDDAVADCDKARDEEASSLPEQKRRQSNDTIDTAAIDDTNDGAGDDDIEQVGPTPEEVKNWGLTTSTHEMIINVLFNRLDEGDVDLANVIATIKEHSGGATPPWEI